MESHGKGKSKRSPQPGKVRERAETLNDLTFQTILESLKKHMDQRTETEIEWLTRLLNLTEIMSEEQFTITLQTLMTMRDEKRRFDRIIKDLK